MLKRINTISPRIYLYGFLAAALVAFLGRTLWLYHGVYVGPTVPQSDPQTIPNLSALYENVAQTFGPGNVVIFDVGHDNGYDEAEMGLLAGRFASGGAQVEFSGDLVDRAHEATVLVISAPSSTFSRDEIVAIEQFTSKGGRLILIGDPTRVRGVEGLNSLASEYGVLYQQDYIYNLEKNDGNFRNVIFSTFAKDNALTDGLDSVVFQTAHSLRTTEDAGVVMGDDSTFVSSSERPGGAIAVAQGGDGNALFLSDMTFLTAPYNGFADNDRFIDNIVGYALSGERQFSVDDFPYYFGATTDVVYQDAALLDKGFDDFDRLRDAMNAAEKSVAVVDEVGKDRPVIYLATYDNVDEDITAALEKSGISLEGRQIAIKDVAALSVDHTVLFHLIPPPKKPASAKPATPPPATATAKPATTAHEPLADLPSYRLIVIGSDQETLSAGLGILISGDLENCVVTPQTAVCHTDQEHGGAGPAPDGSGETPTPGATIGSFLVVADDESAGSADLTSAPDVEAALSSSGNTVKLVSIVNDGLPSSSDMLDYDAVFWSSGNYAPSQDGVDLLKQYLDDGGHLFIDGAEIAFYWKDDSFLPDYLRANYASYGEQLDLQVGPDDHPLSAGFGGALIPIESSSPPDILDAAGSDVVFVRGPTSVQPGAPALVAYTSGNRMVAFAAFQVSLLDQISLQRLIDNAVAWFLSS